MQEDNFGSDELTRRISEAWHNIRATWREHRDIAEMLSSINSLFMKYVDVFCKLSKESNIESSPGAFLARAYGCYLAAVRLSSSGQIAEAFVMYRACIENALYGYYIAENPKLGSIWAQRHQSNQAGKLMRREFRLVDILNFIIKQEPRVGAHIKDMYEKAIDFGAHPNVYSIGCNLQYIEDERKTVMNIFNSDAYFLKCCLLANARYGMGCLSVFRLIYPEQLSKRGVPEELGRLFGRLNELSQKINEE